MQMRLSVSSGRAAQRPPGSVPGHTAPSATHAAPNAVHSRDISPVAREEAMNHMRGPSSAPLESGSRQATDPPGGAGPLKCGPAGTLKADKAPHRNAGLRPRSTSRWDAVQRASAGRRQRLDE
eukprot:Amastigsp_a677266_105.p2 type:complete len:123 gc:universal Amastigsp_a677266_105:959-591(-)